MKNILYTVLILMAVSLTGCETTINPDLKPPQKIIVVDAWINQKMEKQEIRITRSQSYFDNTVPTKITGATVSVKDMQTGTIYTFQEGPTSYVWNPTDTPLGVIGHTYQLTVTIGGETFEAYSKLGRVPPVEAIKFTYNEENLVIKQEHYTAEFLATDPVGVGDAYWIKAWKNGVFLNKPVELNIAYDAGFNIGQSIDGEVFIIPIRRLVNPTDKKPEKSNEFIPPYLVGDSLYVEIHSLDTQAFNFMYGLYFQIVRPGGFAELFSTPLANVTTNLKSTNEASKTQIAGFFNVASVSSRGQKLTQELADAAKQIGK